MQKAFLTGATGFLGGHLASALELGGWQITAACRTSSDTGGVPQCCSIERVDMLDPDSYRDSLEGARVVFHLAGAISARSPESFQKANAAVTAALLEARRRFAPEALFVYVSSQSAGGPSGSRPITPYGRSKLLAESIVRRSSDWIIVRPPAVFGPGDEAMMPLWRSALKGFFFSPAARGGIPLVFVRDLAEFLVALPSSQGAVGMTFEPSYGREFTWRDIHGYVQASAGRRVTHVRVPGPLVLLAGWVSGSRLRFGGKCPVFDVYKSREFLARGWRVSDPHAAGLTGWTASTPPEEAFRQTISWARQRL